MRAALFFSAIGAVVAASAFVPQSARAEVVYPWCAYYGGNGDGATNCYFATYQQCMEALSGNGGYCDRNPDSLVLPPGPSRRVYRGR
ncbi:MAG TPA: DUF3551 domain-containing protein [Xanthobacteraceae bacterium]|jgi:hypothetical protein|nr:DUF3551 domain-containing protein [Xanthobacteraceae bacterium]